LAKDLGAGISGLRWFAEEEEEKPSSGSAAARVVPRLPEDSRPLSLTSPAHAWPREWLRNRGVREHLWKRFGLRYCRVGKLRGRIVIPIREEGRLVGWQARTTGDDIPKYLSMPGFRITDYLFNEDGIFGEEVFLVEGVFDVFALPTRAAALFGAKISDAQVLRIRDRFSASHRVWILMDGDGAGRKAAEEIFHRLIVPCPKTGIIHLPEGKDPGDLPPGELAAIIGRQIAGKKKGLGGR